MASVSFCIASITVWITAKATTPLEGNNLITAIQGIHTKDAFKITATTNWPSWPLITATNHRGAVGPKITTTMQHKIKANKQTVALAVTNFQADETFALNQHPGNFSCFEQRNSPQPLKMVFPLKRVLSAAVRLPSCFRYSRVWQPSRKKVNRQMHALHGNHTCRLCNCSLVDRQYQSLPSCFRNTPLYLGNGMMVHKYYYCSEHLSLWFYRRRERRYGVYYGLKAKNLYSHICAARAARGTPGDHGQPRHYMREFFGIHSHSNRQLLKQASGHESRSASEDKRSHQCLRSTSAMLRRQSTYNESRRNSRREYRLWMSEIVEFGKFTLAQFRRPLKRVQNSPIQLQRAYSELQFRPTIGSRTFLFQHYVQPSLLDLSRRMLSFRPRRNSLTVVTWNIETLIGLGKHESIASFAKSHMIDIIMLQETKSQSSDELRSLGGRFLLSGSPTEPMAGVGFFIAPHILPLVEDFLPYSGRLASLTLRTQPLRTHLIACYAPSQLPDQRSDLIRKRCFWEQMDKLRETLPRPSQSFYAGDFNARIIGAGIQELSAHIGPAHFPSAGDLDTLPQTNYGMMLDFLVINDYCVASTFFTRPSSHIITYREISSTADANPKQPDNTNFATLDHVLSPLGAKHMIKSCTSMPNWNLPWFHRHYPVRFKLEFDKFQKAPVLPVGKTTVPHNTEEKHAFRTALDEALADQQDQVRSLESLTIPGSIYVYTDGSCPDQHNVAVGNPAGWGFTVLRNNIWTDSCGPVGSGLSFVIPGSNNTGELQALLECLDFLLRRKSWVATCPMTVYTDSQFVYDIFHENSNPVQHSDLIAIIHGLLFRLLKLTRVALVKVISHTGNEGNERADRLAKQGVHSKVSVGRHLPPRRDPLPPLVSTEWPRTIKDIDDQARVLSESIRIASKTLTIEAPETYKKEYLSTTTKALIARVEATPNEDVFTLKKLRKAVRRHAKKDKRHHLCDNLLTDSRGPPSQQWKTLKFVRKPYNPRTQGVQKPNGTLCSKSQKSQVLAEHLSEHVWCSPPPKILNQAVFYPEAPVKLEPFTSAELDRALNKVKTRRAPGPDKLPGELLKYSSRNFKRLLLDHYNSVFYAGVSPGNWKHSEVIMIFKGKKKDPKCPRSYRPISLVNVIYKVYASMLHHRLKEAIEERLSPFQFGFRPGRSTSTPLFVLRRLLELHERYNTSFYALFLDWSQAFDSVSHEALRAAMHRMGVPHLMITAILSIYHDCTFMVRDSSSASTTQSFRRGIRQGCPLSPYLFILVLTVLLRDVHISFDQQYGRLPSVITGQTWLCDIEYADDTVLLARTSLSMHRLLHILQYEADLIGLHLNIDKCQLLVLNTDTAIHLINEYLSPCPCAYCRNESPVRPNPDLQVSPTTHAAYLGSMLMPNASAEKDVFHRYSQALSAHKALAPFYRHSDISIRRKLLVHAQIVMAILLYDSESQTYTPTQLMKLNSVHFKVLRQIFGIKSSFYHRVLEPSEELCSNEFLMNLVKEHVPHLMAPSQKIISTRISYLGHILRHEDELEHYTIFQSSHAYRRFFTRRPGKPRVHWPELAMAEAYQRQQHYSRGEPRPPLTQLDHPIYQHAQRQLVMATHSVHYGNATLWRTLHPVAQNRRSWTTLVSP